MSWIRASWADLLAAGLPEHEEEGERLERGIPYHPEVIEWFKSITSELGIPDRLPSV